MLLVEDIEKDLSDMAPSPITTDTIKWPNMVALFYHNDEPLF
jgi:hypothetical protein